MRDLNSNKGIGLLELMLSIIVITAIVLGATKYYLVAREAMKVTQAQEIINSVAEAAYKWVEGSPNWSGLSMDELVTQKGLLPSRYLGKIDPWGGAEVQVSSDEDTNWFFIRFGGSASDIPDKPWKILEAKYGSCPSSFRTVDSLVSCADGDSHTFYFRAP